MSTTQDGNGFPFLSEAVYTYLSTGKYTNIIVDIDDVPGEMLKFAVEKVITNYSKSSYTKTQFQA